MKKLGLIFLTLALLAAFVPLGAQVGSRAQAQAQGGREKQVKTPENFDDYFHAIMVTNPKIRDFHHMEVGKTYNLPGGGQDALQEGDTDGIWGRELNHWNSDPTTSGPAVVEGGIRENETDRLNRHFDDLASALHATRMGPVEPGNIVGDGMVGYRNAPMQPHHIENPLRAYRAHFRLENGTESDFITLQACMNPVNSGQIYQGFVFTPDGPSVQTLPPTAAPQAAGWFRTRKRYWIPALVLLFLGLAALGGLNAKKRAEASKSDPEEVTEEPAPKATSAPASVSNTDVPTQEVVPRPSGLARESSTPVADAIVAASTVPVVEEEAATPQVVAPPRSKAAAMAAAERPSAQEEPLVIAPPTQPRPASKENTRTQISFTPADDNRPNMLQWNANLVELHGIEIEENGTHRLRYSLKNTSSTVD